MTNNTIICPQCGNEISVDDAIRHQIEDDYKKTYKDKQKQIELEISKKEKDLAEREKLVEKSKKDIDLEVTERLKLEKTKLTNEVKEELTKEKQEEIEILGEKLKEKEEKLDEARKNELELRKEKTKLEDEKKAFELEKQRQIDKEREIIRQKTAEEILEQHRLKDKEKDTVIEGLKKALEEAKRKAEQGSQQIQGEVLEIDLEEQLRAAFPGDVIEPIAKGTLGADIRQIVRSPKGNNCGSILWESKRTKGWTEGWITKLKNDMRSDKANIAAIVSETLPQELKEGIGLKDGVWVCEPKLVIPLSMLLRKSLLDAAYQKAVTLNKQSKADLIYQYVTSNEFQQQVESLVEVYIEMRDQISKERTAFEKLWKQREAQVTRLLSGVGGIYGYLQGIAGSALPQVKNLELASGDEDS